MECVLCGHSQRRDGHLAIKSTVNGPMCMTCIDEAINLYYKLQTKR